MLAQYCATTCASEPRANIVATANVRTCVFVCNICMHVLCGLGIEATRYMSRMQALQQGHITTRAIISWSTEVPGLAQKYLGRAGEGPGQAGPTAGGLAGSLAGATAHQARVRGADEWTMAQRLASPGAKALLGQRKLGCSGQTRLWSTASCDPWCVEIRSGKGQHHLQSGGRYTITQYHITERERE